MAGERLGAPDRIGPLSQMAFADQPVLGDTLPLREPNEGLAQGRGRDDETADLSGRCV
ncbi:hypothetical protein PSEUDO9AG_50138 [Pseudomonas sp. 9Ag]|nr:hypothetical protein PSEUDO9AG_50138 [Pseudomonas sp. 9Ag]